MDYSNHRIVSEKAVQILCLGVLGVILLAGLWPFRAPTNQVRWIENENGLEFGRYGSVVSSSVFPVALSSASSSCSLEIWLRPGLAQSTGTILAFEGVGSPVAPFSIQQHRSALRLRRHNVDNVGTYRTAVFDVAGAFQAQKSVFVTITLDFHSTSVYLDGVLVKTEAISGASTNNFSGRLLLANAPFANDSWPGRILGVASYDRHLTPAQIVQHYKSWTQTQRPAILADQAPMAVYLFNERAGTSVRNQLDDATNLAIPTRYFVLHPSFLTYPWREYQSTGDYWMDLGVNVAGFIPLGFAFVWLCSVRAVRWPAATVIAMGFATSLTIEILQAFLPTRNSGMTDLITNTFGTAIGVMFYRWSFMQSMLTKAKQMQRQKMGSPIEPDSGLAMCSSDSAALVDTKL